MGVVKQMQLAEEEKQAIDTLAQLEADYWEVRNDYIRGRIELTEALHWLYRLDESATLVDDLCMIERQNTVRALQPRGYCRTHGWALFIDGFCKRCMWEDELGWEEYFNDLRLEYRPTVALRCPYCHKDECSH